MDEGGMRGLAGLLSTGVGLVVLFGLMNAADQRGDAAGVGQWAQVLTCFGPFGAACTLWGFVQDRRAR